MNCKSKKEIDKFFKKFDIFGTRISLKYNSNSTHQTCWGAFVSLSIIVYLFYQLLLQAESLLQGKNFQLVYSENYQSDPKLAKISATEFPFALGIKYNNSSGFLQRESFFIEGIQFSTQRILNNQTNLYEYQTIQESFSLEPCSETNFQIDEIANEIKKYPLSFLYCIPQSSSYYLQGQSESQIYQFIRFKISYCKNSANCVESLQNQQQVSLYTLYVNRIIDADRLENPLIPTIQSMQWAASNGTKTIDLRFKNTFVNSQIGILFQQMQNLKKLLFSSDQELITDYNKNGIIFELNMSLENNIESVYNIKQQTLVQFFSSIGGLVNCFYFIGLILAMPASKFSYNQKLLNSIFNFQLDQNQQELTEQQSPPIDIENQTFQITQYNNNDKTNTVNQNNRSILKQKQKYTFNRSHTIQTSQTARDPLNSDITFKAYNNSIFRKNNMLKESDDHRNTELVNSYSIAQKSDVNQNEVQFENNQNKDQSAQINQDQTVNECSTINLNDNQLTSKKNQEQLNESFFSVQDRKLKRTNTSLFYQNQDAQTPLRYFRRCETQKLEDLAISDFNKRNEDESKYTDDKMSTQHRKISQQVQINTDNNQNITISKTNIDIQNPKNISNLISQMDIIKNKMKIKIQDQLLSIFCKKKIKSQMINYGIEKINDFLDVNMLIKTIVEFQKLKRILLSKDQLILFELIPPPLIHEQQFTNKISDEENENNCYSAFNTGTVFEDYRTQTKKMKDAQNSYNKIFKSSNDQHRKPSFIDNQILLYIGQSLKKQFDENNFR
ncbi:hypothetical protein ABPG74_017008 [Tetrahymena malaccensis]